MDMDDEWKWGIRGKYKRVMKHINIVCIKNTQFVTSRHIPKRQIAYMAYSICKYHANIRKINR